MTRRLHQIVLLLRSPNDAPFALPETSDGKRIRLSAKRGESPSRRVECPNCQGHGTVKVRGFAAPCERCGGRFDKDYGNFVKFGRGWVEVDDYIDPIRAHSLALVRESSKAVNDDQIASMLGCFAALMMMLISGALVVLALVELYRWVL